MRIRKLVTVVEKILEDGGKAVPRPVKKAAAVAGSSRRDGSRART